MIDQKPSKEFGLDLYFKSDRYEDILEREK